MFGSRLLLLDVDEIQHAVVEDDVHDTGLALDLGQQVGWPVTILGRCGAEARLLRCERSRVADRRWRRCATRGTGRAFADADIPHRVAVFADAYGMTARQRAELAPFSVDMARRYHEDSRASAELDPVFRKLWEDGAKEALPRAEAWLREAAPAITARLGQPG